MSRLQLHCLVTLPTLLHEPMTRPVPRYLCIGQVSCQPRFLLNDGNVPVQDSPRMADKLGSRTNQAASDAGSAAKQAVRFVGWTAEAALAAAVPYYSKKP